ncbi:BLUF domain-containing protein [Afifella sp. IM 167]|uniref:BLUF domain-containing protein n=1 Tax=Afifella sp. IM 167 TaxID=2033586 RepID=UPI001CCA86D3|nr:BLUF domain-containing protein [Afifella sp. IM 167]MBZ8131690.1 blue light sensor protein [Afifella sp. IM 167]
MEDPVYRLVYRSRNRVLGDRDEFAGHIAHILSSSQTNNARNGITGALLFNSGIFAQTLEGPLKAVERTFETIQRDPRHADVLVLFLERVNERVFPSWSMAFVGRSREEDDLFGHLGEKSDPLTTHLEGERILGIIREIAEEEETSPAG